MYVICIYGVQVFAYCLGTLVPCDTNTNTICMHRSVEARARRDHTYGCTMRYNTTEIQHNNRCS